MAWEISMGSDGWETLRESLGCLPKGDLVAALACGDVGMRSAQGDDQVDADELAQNSVALLSERMSHYVSLPMDVLRDAAMAMIEEHRTCENGGHAIYIDPDGDFKVELSAAAEAEVYRVLGEIQADVNDGPLSVGQVLRWFPEGGLPAIIGPEKHLCLADGMHAIRVQVGRDEASVEVLNSDAEVVDASTVLDDPNLVDDLADAVLSFSHQARQEVTQALRWGDDEPASFALG